MNTSNKSCGNETTKSNRTFYSDTDLSSMQIDESVLDLIDKTFNENVNLHSNLRTDEKHKGFDPSMGKSWIYPVNYQRRHYQFNICCKALFKNTLVRNIFQILVILSNKRTIDLRKYNYFIRWFCRLAWVKRL